MKSLDLTVLPETMARILVIKFRHHGDMLMITPVIESLHDAYPQAKIDVLLYEETRPMLALHPAINRIYSIDRSWKKQGKRYQLGQEWQLLKTLRKQHYSLVVNLADQWRSAIITRFTGAPSRLGFDFPKRSGKLWQLCHTQLVTTEGHNDLHVVEQNLSLLTPLRLASLNKKVTMSYSDDDLSTVRQLTQGLSNYIVVQPTSRWFFKCWSDDKFALTLDALSQEGYAIVLTSGPAKNEMDMIASILSRMQTTQNTLSLAGQLTLPQLGALIDHARLFIGVDSVPMHMAAALQTPCLALFGPSKLVFWRPWQVKGEIIWAGDFGPLPDPDKVDTRTTQRYLDAIPSDVVIATAKRLLS